MDMSSVQSIERTFSIIEALSQTADGISLRALTSLTGLSKSTIHRLLGTLKLMKYVEQDDRTGTYRLTIKMFEVGSRIIDKLDVNVVSRPYLENLSEILGEAVHLVIRDGNDVVYIYKEDSGFNKSSVRMSSRIGLRSPLYCTAVGKSILAELPPDEVENIWKTSKIVQHTPNTITSLEKLKGQLIEIRNKGYAIDDEENEIGVRCVGACLLDYSRKIAGAFSVSVPISRIDDNRLREISELVLQTRREICSLLGYSLQ